MGILNFTAFGGIAPRADPVTLPAGYAQVANNCRFTSGALEGYKGLQIVNNTAVNGLSTGTINNIYRMGISHSSSDVLNNPADYWLVSGNANLSVVKGAIANDQDERTYMTDGIWPKMTTINFATSSHPYPGVTYRLGLPAPGLKADGSTDASMAPNVVVTGPIDPTVAGEVRYYCYTYIDAATAWAPGAYAFNQESGPSAVSLPVKYYASSDPALQQTITVQIPAPSTSANGYIISGIRLYRTSVTTSGSAKFQYVGTYQMGPNTITDTLPNTSLGEVLPTQIASLLPNTALGLTGMANGMMAAFNGYDVYFCEPYKPYSWPVDYMQTVDYPIIGIGAFGTTLAVLTTGVPFLMTGSDPQSISVQKLPYDLICMSRKSVISTDGGVIYASQEGLVSIGLNGVRILTDAVMTRREWMGYNPASMVCGYWEGKTFIFYNATSLGNGIGGLILDSDGRLTTIDPYATHAYSDPASGALYLAVNGKIVKWDSGTNSVTFDQATGAATWGTAVSPTYTWHSKREMLPRFNNFGWAQVVATAYPITLKVYQDGTLTSTVIVSSSTPVRLVSGMKSRFWEVEVTGVGRLFQVILANSTAEIQSA